VSGLATDPRVASISERRKNQQLVWTLLNKFAEKYTKRELIGILTVCDRCPLRVVDARPTLSGLTWLASNVVEPITRRRSRG